MRWMLCVVITGSLCVGVAQSESNINPDYKWAWGENIGWLNWRHEAPADPNKISEGVFIGDTYLGGFMWAENVGWINVGDASPANGVHYANLDDTDFGVNLDPNTGELSGYGWGENVGWINFRAGASAEPPNPARFEDDCRLRGYVWGENIGWINLDDEEHLVARLLDGDLDYDGDVDLADLGYLLAPYGCCEGNPCYDPVADIDGDGCVGLADLGILLAYYGQTCP
jgi:hypothetical protein